MVRDLGCGRRPLSPVDRGQGAQLRDRVRGRAPDQGARGRRRPPRRRGGPRRHLCGPRRHRGRCPDPGGGRGLRPWRDRPDQGGRRGRGRRDRVGGRGHGRRGSDRPPADREQVGGRDHPEGAACAPDLPGRDRGLHLLAVRMEDGDRVDDRPHPRPHHHGRRLLAHRLRSHPLDRDRDPDDPGLFPVRHGRRVRQARREHDRSRGNGAHDLCGRRQPFFEPGVHAFAEHVPGHHPPGRRIARCGCRPSRCRDAEGPRTVALRRAYSSAPTHRSSSPVPVLSVWKEREPLYRNVREKALRNARKAAAAAPEADGPAEEGEEATPAAVSVAAKKPTSASPGAAPRSRAGSKKVKRRKRR